MVDFAGNFLAGHMGAREQMRSDEQQANANALAPLQQERLRLGIDQTRQSMALDQERMTMLRQKAAQEAAMSIKTQADAEAAQADIEQGRRLIATAAAGGPGAEMAWRELASGIGNPDLEFSRESLALASEVFSGLEEGFLSAAGNAAFGAPEPEAPAAIQTLRIRAQEAGLQPGTPEYQQFMASGGRAETGMEIIQGPDGLTFRQGPGVTNAPDAPPITPAAPTSGAGEQFQNAPDAFGGGSVVRGGINWVADVTTGRVPFPDTLEAQRDFAVFGEGLINSFAAAYGRQPPSWLLRNIEQLTPKQGSLFEGPAQAQSKLRSISRELRQRREGFAVQLERSPRPNERQELMAQIAGIDATLTQLNAAMEGFSEAPIELRPDVSERLKAYE